MRPRDVTTAIVGQPLDGDRQTIDQPEAVLDSPKHEIAHIVAGNAACRGQEAQGFPITAVEGEGDPDLLTLITADLKAIGAPTTIPLNCPSDRD